MPSRTAATKRFPAIPQHQDTFTRADSALTLGTLESGGATWTSTATWGIATNQAYNVNATADISTYIETGSPDCEIEVACTSGGGSVNYGIYFRSTTNGAAANSWRFIRNSSTLLVQRNGSTQRTITGVTFGTLDKFRVRCYGNNIKCFFNDSLVASIVDATNNTGTKHGMGVGSTNGASAHRFDNFKLATPI